MYCNLIMYLFLKTWKIFFLWHIASVVVEHGLGILAFEIFSSPLSSRDYLQCRRPTDVGLIPGSRRSPAGGHGNPLQHSCLENPMDREAWQATVLRVIELDMVEVTEYTQQTWDATSVPCVGRWILNHCTTREVLQYNS